VGGWAALLMVVLLFNVLFCCSIEILLLAEALAIKALLQG